MVMTAHERVRYHLEQAEDCSRALDAETKLQGDPVIHEETQMVAVQGMALRRLLYHCTAALCAQLEKATMRR